MEITRNSAKDLVRDLNIFENRLSESFKGNKDSNDYLISLQRNLKTLTLDHIAGNNYKLEFYNKATDSMFKQGNNDHNHLFVYYLIELSNSIAVDGLTKTYDLAYTLFNDLFKNIN